MNFLYLNYFFILLNIFGFHSRVGVCAQKSNCTAMKSCNRTVCTNEPRNCRSEVDIADPFRTNSKNDEDVIKFIKPNDNDYYSTLCWIEITKIKDILTDTGIERYVTREYAISVETPADFKNNINKNENFSYHKSLKFGNHHNNTDFHEIEPFEIYESDTKKSTVVNFTTVSIIDNVKVREHKKKFCGAGPILITETNQWSNSMHKKLEIRVSPKKQKLKAAECNNQTKSITIVTEKSIITQSDLPSRRTEGNDNNLTRETEHTTELSLVPKEKRITETISFAPLVKIDTTKVHKYSSSFDPFQFPQGGTGDTPDQVTTKSRTYNRKITTNPKDLLSPISTIIGSEIATENQKLEETTTIRETLLSTPPSVDSPPSNQTNTENIQETKTTSSKSINLQSKELEETTESKFFSSTEAITTIILESTYNTISPSITLPTNVKSDATTTDDFSMVPFTEFVPPIIIEEASTDATTTAFDEFTNATSEIDIQTTEQTTKHYIFANEPERNTSETEITTPGGGKIASLRRIPNTKSISVTIQNVSTDTNLNGTQKRTTESVSNISTPSESGIQETGTPKQFGITKSLPEIALKQDIVAKANIITTELNTKLPDIVTNLEDLTTSEFTTINNYTSTKIKITGTVSVLSESPEVSTTITEGSTSEMNSDYLEKISTTTEANRKNNSTEIYLTSKILPDTSTYIDNYITETPLEIGSITSEKNEQPTNILNISTTESDTTEVSARHSNMENSSPSEILDILAEKTTHMKYFSTNIMESTNRPTATNIISTEIVTTAKTLPEITQSALSTVNNTDEAEITTVSVEMNKKLMTDIVSRIESTETFTETFTNVDDLTSFTTSISEVNENVISTENDTLAILSLKTGMNQKLPKTKNNIIDTTENDDESRKFTTSAENLGNLIEGKIVPGTESMETDYPESISADSKEDTLSTVVFSNSKILENGDLISSTELSPVMDVFTNKEYILLSASTSSQTTYVTPEYNAVSNTIEETKFSNNKNMSEKRKSAPGYIQILTDNELSTDGIVTNSIIDRIGTTNGVPEVTTSSESISYEDTDLTTNNGHTSDLKSTVIPDKNTEIYTEETTVTESSLDTTKADTRLIFLWSTRAQKSESVSTEVTVNTEQQTSRKYYRASDSVPELTNKSKEEIRVTAELITTPFGEISSLEPQTISGNLLITSESTTDKTTQIANGLMSRNAIDNETTTEIESNPSTTESVITAIIITEPSTAKTIDERWNKTKAKSSVSTTATDILNEIITSPLNNFPGTSPIIPMEVTTPGSIETSTIAKTLNAKNTSSTDPRTKSKKDEVVTSEFMTVHNKTISTPVIQPNISTSLKLTRRTNYPYTSTPISPTEKPSEISSFVPTTCEVSFVSGTSKMSNNWPTAIKPRTIPPASSFAPCETVITTSTNIPLCLRINDDDLDKCKVINRHISKSPCIISKERGTTPFNVSPLICFSYSIKINSTERHFCYDSRTCSKEYLKQHIRTLLKFASNDLFNDKLCNISIKIEREDTKYANTVILSNPKTLFELYDSIDKLLNELDKSNNRKDLPCKSIKDLNNQEANLLLSKLIQYVFKTPLEALPYTSISYRSYPPFLTIPLQSQDNY